MTINYHEIEQRLREATKGLPYASFDEKCFFIKRLPGKHLYTTQSDTIELKRFKILSLSKGKLIVEISYGALPQEYIYSVTVIKKGKTSSESEVMSRAFCQGEENELREYVLELDVG